MRTELMVTVAASEKLLIFYYYCIMFMFDIEELFIAVTVANIGTIGSFWCWLF